MKDAGKADMDDDDGFEEVQDKRASRRRKWECNHPMQAVPE